VTEKHRTAQWHEEPDIHLEAVRAGVPRYDELQDEAIDAIPLTPGQVLELGVGTGETTGRLLERFPEAEVIGLDSSPEMVFRAQELGIETRLARIEDPLPDGPWDLVISVLTVHHLKSAQKRDLFRRVREQARSGVIGDMVAADVQVTPIEPRVDFPDPAANLAEWCCGEVAWAADDLAVVRAVYR
jgi:tRNA (cmo5U34)-methyltransferase